MYKNYRQSGCQEGRTALDDIKLIFNDCLFLHFLILEVLNQVLSFLFLFIFIVFCFSSLSPFLCSFLHSFFPYTLSFLSRLSPSLLPSHSSFSLFLTFLFPMSFLLSIYLPFLLLPTFHVPSTHTFSFLPFFLAFIPYSKCHMKEKQMNLRETKSCCWRYEGEVCPCSTRRQQSCWRF